MKWPWTRSNVLEPVAEMNGHLEEAEDAVARAREAAAEAEAHLKEMRELARRAVFERTENHFAPDIYEAWKRKD